jgi:DNA-binding MarR family transcriptional regulator
MKGKMFRSFIAGLSAVSMARRRGPTLNLALVLLAVGGIVGTASATPQARGHLILYTSDSAADGSREIHARERPPRVHEAVGSGHGERDSSYINAVIVVDVTAPTPNTDPTEEGRWRPLRLLMEAMDGEIAKLYAERGVTGVRPRFTMPLIRLAHRGPMTIRQLADSLELTHSAVSQTVSALRREGLVTSAPGSDARTREVALTDQARELVPFLEAEWRATEQAVADLEAETPYALSQVVRDLEAALARRPFYDRIVQHLTEPDAS